MQFREAADYLFSLGNEVTAMKLGLENIRTLLAELGDPQDRYLKVQVAGTNGKGSVCAFLRSICHEAGIKAGVYTSPHLVSVTERINVEGRDISEAEFAVVATKIRKAAERMLSEGRLEYRPTFFEHLTAMALAVFADAGVEVAILETGLGGRLDATTAANAEIAALTRIDLDHQNYLGNTIEEIAKEKAAIIHKGSRVVVGQQSDRAMSVILDRCREMGVSRSLADDRRSATALPVSMIGLVGEHQVENAAIAVLVAEAMVSALGRKLSRQQILKGLENARHPGRLEYRGQYLLDGAHNIGSAKALASFIRENEARPITLVFGAMSDKDVGEMTSILFPLADRIVLTRPDNPRAMSVDELAAFASDSAIKSVDVGTALEIAEDITPEDGIIVITGSLYLVGEAMKFLKHI